MIQEEKELLLKDLLGRVLYGVKVDYHNNIFTLGYNLYLNNGDVAFENYPMFYFLEKIEKVKPYLRPMSSMTEEERKEWFKQSRVEYDCEFHTEPTLSLCNCHLSTDWLNKNLFDYRGLIPMGLALPAKEGMYQQLKGQEE